MAVFLIWMSWNQLSKCRSCPGSADSRMPYVNVPLTCSRPSVTDSPREWTTYVCPTLKCHARNTRLEDVRHSTFPARGNSRCFVPTAAVCVTFHQDNRLNLLSPWTLSFPFFCYLTTLLTRLHSVDNKMMKEYGAVCGMTIGRGNQNARRKITPALFCAP